MDPKSANSTGNTADKGTDREQVPMDLDDQERKSTNVTDNEAVRTLKRKRMSTLESLNWVKNIARDPLNPANVSLPDSSIWNDFGEEDHEWRQILLFRQERMVKLNAADSEALKSMWELNAADSEAQKSPSKVGDTMKPEDHLVAVRHSPSMTSPTNISNQAISSKWPKAKKTHSSSRPISTDTQSDLKDAGQSSHGDDPLLGFWFRNETRASIPVGTFFQIELPECSKNAYEGDTKWLGTLIWPQGQVVEPNVLPTGFGRHDQCTCLSRGSSECVRFHLSEERNRLKLELGMSFDQFRFDTMGEAAASSWSTGEQARFAALMRTNPPNVDENVWDKIRRRFRTKRMDQLVSYYFNVYQIRRHRQNPNDTESDDDIVAEKFMKHR